MRTHEPGDTTPRNATQWPLQNHDEGEIRRGAHNTPNHSIYQRQYIEQPLINAAAGRTEEEYVMMREANITNGAMSALLFSNTTSSWIVCWFHCSQGGMRWWNDRDRNKRLDSNQRYNSWSHFVSLHYGTRKNPNCPLSLVKMKSTWQHHPSTSASAHDCLSKPSYAHIIWNCHQPTNPHAPALYRK